MFRRFASILAILLTGIIIGGTLQPFQNLTSFAQPGCQTFSETGKSVCGRFLQYWQQNGGLRQQGFPISDEFQERSDTDGKLYTVQYFERSVFEYHPELAPPNDVLLSLLGVFFYKQKYVVGTPSPPPSPTTAIPCAANIAAASNGGSIAFATSTYDEDFVPENLIDGDARTGWSSVEGAVRDQYVTFALPDGATYTINRVRLNPYTASSNESLYRTDSIKDFEIRVSTTISNNDNFRSVFRGTAPLQNDFFQYTIPTVEAKYVMLYVASNHGGNFVEAREFEVYQACSGGSPLFGGIALPPQWKKRD